MAVTDRDIKTIAPGASLKSYAPGFFIQSLRIDNLSGSWLFVETLHQYVPPYTIGWARQLTWQARSVTVLAQDGPSGQKSTNEGDPVVLTTYGALTPENTGLAFVTRHDEPEIRTYLNPLTFSAVNGSAQAITNILGGVTTKRIRVYSLVAVNGNAAGLRLTQFIDCNAVNPAFATIIATAGIDPNRNSDTSFITPPYDMPLGQEVVVNAQVMGWSGAADNPAVGDIKLNVNVAVF